MKKIILFFSLMGVFLCVSCSGNNKKEEPIPDTTVAMTTNVESTQTNETIENGVENIENEFFTLLDDIKNVHPGTAGCSIQVLIVGARLLNACKLKLPVDYIASAWVDKQDTESYADINESFNFVLENIDNLDDPTSIEIIKENGMQDEYTGPWDQMVKNIAKVVLNVVIDKTKQ